MNVDNVARYLKPNKQAAVVNGLVTMLARVGVSVWGSRMLTVRGRWSGKSRSVPVNVLVFEGERHLVAPRGETQWVRNLRVAGEGELRVGRRVERFTPVELIDEDKPTVLRAYLRRWKFEVGTFFDGVDAQAPEETLRAMAPRYPIFRVIAR